jgi:hypothetical protein
VPGLVFALTAVTNSLFWTYLVWEKTVLFDCRNIFLTKGLVGARN